MKVETTEADLMNEICTRNGDEFEPRSRLVSKPGGQQSLPAAARAADDDAYRGLVRKYGITIAGKSLITTAVCAPEQGRMFNSLFQALLLKDDDCGCESAGDGDGKYEPSAAFLWEGMQPMVHERSCFLVSSRPSTTGTGWEPIASPSGQVSNSAEVGCRSQ